MLKKPAAADALYVLKDALRLSSYPYRIEAFDVSNLAGAEAMGAMAVFIDGMPQFNEYRYYKIKSVTTIDDYAMLKELSLIHISEPTRRTPISYAVFCLKK